MSLDDCSMQQLVAQLRTAHFQSYLLSRGWVETPSNQTDQRRFESGVEGGDGVYELYVPASPDVAKFQTRLLRNLHKLCDIEDREPAEIAREMVATPTNVEAPVFAPAGTRLRIQNSGSTPLRVEVEFPAREHTLYAQEAIELICGDGECLRIDRTEDAIIIRKP